MTKRQIFGVEELAGQSEASAAGAAAVQRIATDRIPDRGKVRAYLVRPPGDEPDAQQRGPRQLLLDLEVRDRVARLVGASRHDRPRSPIATDRRIDRPAAGVGPPVDQRQILAPDLA